MKVKNYRILRKLTQKEFAKKCKVSRRQINRIENHRGLPSRRLVLKLSKELEMCPYIILNYCEKCPIYPNCIRK